MKVFLALFLALSLFVSPALAQEAPVEPFANEEAAESGARLDIDLPARTSEDDERARRVELAQQMHKLRPVRDQVSRAVEQYAQTQPENQREAFKTTMRSVLNYNALEKISTDAYADTFTLKELEAMVEYYSKPEARSASDKFDSYGALVYPEIIRMLDKALIRVRTGGQ